MRSEDGLGRSRSAGRRYWKARLKLYGHIIRRDDGQPSQRYYGMKTSEDVGGRLYQDEKSKAMITWTRNKKR
jgi:hypothetical protein